MTAPIQLFDLARRQNEWLSTRQSLIAGNVANANTPGYRARDIKPFEAHLDAAMSMTATQPMHLASVADTAASTADTEDGTDIVHSGNSVSLENEFGKSGEVQRAFTLNTSIVKAFHRMMMMSARG